MNNVYPKFGEVYFASLQAEEHVQGGIRPVVITQNNKGNMHSPTTRILPFTTKVNKASYLPVHVQISPNRENGLKFNSVVLVEQVRTIPINSLIKKIGSLSHDDLIKVGRAEKIQSPFPKS